MLRVEGSESNLVWARCLLHSSCVCSSLMRARRCKIVRYESATSEFVDVEVTARGVWCCV